MINKRVWCSHAATNICLLLTALIFSGPTVSAANRPDIVVFLSDDHTMADSSVYGSEDVKTPNMERLAAAGMTFNQAFVASPSCAPSRASLLTGLMPARNGAEENHSRPAADIKKLPAYLQELGYQVVSFGKVGHYAQTPEYGFDIARFYHYHEDICVPKAVEWLKQRSNNKPLCLFVGTNWPHVPWPEAKAYQPGDVEIPVRHVETPTTREARAQYYEAIMRMDRDLGKVYDTARETLGKDTVFLSTSDHGAQWPFGKWTLYEAGIRTPLIVSWPGHIKAGVRTDAMVSWVDILPTLVDIAGGDPPQKIDGRSFLPVLLGKTDAHRERIFTTHSGDGNFNVYPSRSVRTDRWKYILNLYPDFKFESHVTEVPADYWTSWVEKAESSEEAARNVRQYNRRPREELYDLQNDPQELHNLADDKTYAEQKEKLHGELLAWMEEQEDQRTIYGLPQLLPLPTGKKPNVVVVLIDDMGWSDLSCFGGTEVETQNIDRLAEEGLRFTNFYVNSPICSPSRTALTTGHYPARHDITSYLASRKKNNQRGIAQWLDVDATTLPRMLSENSYATGHFGKWHMGGQRDVANAPLITEYGFDASLTNFEGLGPRVLPLLMNQDGSLFRKHDLGSADLGHGPVTWLDRSLVTTAYVDRAIEFINNAQEKGETFYLNLWPDDVHGPWHPPAGRWGDGSKRDRYLGVLDTMDEQLGVFFDRIRNDPALRENTLILLMSDNGPERGAGTSDPLRGRKGNLYEAGIRSPLIVWGPGILKDDVAGTINKKTIVSSVDLVPSLLTLTGTEAPEDYKPDGEDLLAVLMGICQAQRSDPLFWRRPPDHPGPAKNPLPDLAVRDRQWKLLCDINGKHAELYNLNKDENESNNVAKKHPKITTRLRKAVLAWNETLPTDAVSNDAREPVSVLPPDQFVNPIAEGSDPSVVRDGDQYLWVQSEGNAGVAIWASNSLTTMGRKHIIWESPETGPYSRQIWAPELVKLDGHWYIYFAASDGENRNHRTYVLKSETADPLGEYNLFGPLYTGDHFQTRQKNLWAIDMSVFQHDGKLYAVWSGWPNLEDDLQFLYIAPMASPTKIGGPRVKISDSDDYLWERVEETKDSRGLNEAPQVISHEGRTFLIYSCAASWLPTYKLGMLELVGDNPLDPESWKKFPEPVFQSTRETYGVGHGCFVKSLDGSEWWHIYHAKQDREPGWRRAIHVQPMHWSDDGLPQLGKPVPAGKPLPLPAGEPVSVTNKPGQWTFQNQAALADFRYYGHHQYIASEKNGLHLGKVPQSPVNEYRCGEKVILDGRRYKDVEITATLSFLDGHRDAGILFRVSAPAVGYDAQRGYFAGLVPGRGTLILGKMDGKHWHHLAEATVDIDVDQPQTLRVRAVGDSIQIFHNGSEKPLLAFRDDSFAIGSVGLRVVNTHAAFHSLAVAPAP